jgi:hypothetical protein
MKIKGTIFNLSEGLPKELPEGLPKELPEGLPKELSEELPKELTNKISPGLTKPKLVRENYVDDITRYPVHCEFKFGKLSIVVSSTHWCNLEEVNSNVNIDTLRREYTNTFGIESQHEVDEALTTPIGLTSLMRAVSSGKKQPSQNI